ncbi:MAG TPA: cell division protein FtsA [Clostridiaceae bacterium]|nr:cell division protein FtsA [Clostridiaceae bacterium]
MGSYIVSLDIGTTKVCTLIGRVNRANQLEIVGEGIAPCNGVKKGVIVDIESVSNSIRDSIKQAETMANISVGSAYVNIYGMHVNVINNKSSIEISDNNHEVSPKDVEKLLYKVRDLEIPEDCQIIDIIPRQYIIDGYDEIIDPVGMVGLRLEVDADVIIGKITSAQNIVKSLERAGLKIDGLIIEAFATGELLLTPDEKEIGAILIDVGGGITDISVFKNKRLIFYDSIPVGGDHITNDISIGLKISHSEAEKIKRQFELALTSLINNDQEFAVNTIEDNKRKKIKVSEVVEIIEARVHEIFYICRNMLEKAKITIDGNMTVVLTGGGISYVDGNKQLASEVFEIPARVALYRSASVSKSEFATAAGMIRFVSNTYKSGNAGSKVILQKGKNSLKKRPGFFKKILKLLERLS